MTPEHTWLNGLRDFTPRVKRFWSHSLAYTISYFPRFVFYMTIQKFWIHHVDGYITETPNSQGNACQFTCLICPLFVCLHVLIQLYFFVLHSWWHTRNVLQSYFHKNGKIFLDRQGLTTDQTRTENVGDIVVFISNTTMRKQHCYCHTESYHPWVKDIKIFLKIKKSYC